MSQTYRAVRWNRNKIVYDTVLSLGIAAYLALFVLVGRLFTEVGAEVLILRALGTCALVMLHLVLGIGPLTRWEPRFLPLLVNRRHLGVATFLVGLAHGILATGYYHGFGRLNPVVSLLTANTNYGDRAAFPFEILGLVALGILFLMAATSHDFWQRTLAQPLWKGLHLFIYPAYVLLVFHVLLGALQSETSGVYTTLLVLGAGTVAGLHLATGLRETWRDRGGHAGTGWIDVGPVDDIPDCRAKVVCLASGERVAVFRYGGRVSAVTNVCAHQGGPLGEGKIFDGCITCPWHGWDYRPHNGQAPPPFEEKITTYRVRVEGRRVLLNPEPLPPGTPTEPGCFEEKTP